MPESSSSSFIPKRGATQKLRQAPRRYNLYILSIISYALFIAAPVASAAVYVYKLYNERQVTTAAETLQGEIATFKAADFEKVLEFDRRLKSASLLLDSHISIASALTILEGKTAQSIGITGLTISRTDADTLTAEGKLETDSFNAALFQRGIYSTADQIASTTLEGVAFAPVLSSEGESESASAEQEDVVSFEATFVFSAEEILYTPQTNNQDAATSNQDTPEETTDSELDDEAEADEVTPETDNSDTI